MKPGARRDEVTPDLLLRAYSVGLFPMAESADDAELHWVDPPARGVFPLDGLRVSRRLARTLRSDRFGVRADRDFDAVIDACAEEGPGRGRTWINPEIKRLYRALHARGHAHCIAAFDGEGALAGGLYGVSLGAAFFGESMFHRATDASKVALVHLVARLRAGGFVLLDAQFVTPHLASLGAVEIPRADYLARLGAAIGRSADFAAFDRAGATDGAAALAAAV